MYTIYINNTLPPALAVHEIYRDIFGPPMQYPAKENEKKPSCGTMAQQGNCHLNVFFI